jgi:hypothetical protein
MKQKNSASAAQASLTGTGFALLSLAVSAWLAQAMVLGCLGPWRAQVHLVHSLSSAVPAWVAWDLDGARTAPYVAGAWVSLLLLMLWSALVWRAGVVAEKLERSILLLGALLLTLAAVGTGSAGLVIAMMIGASAAWGLIRHSMPQPPATSRPVALSAWFRRHGLKPLFIAGGLGGAALAGIRVMWDTSWANQPPAHFTSLMPVAISGACGLMVAGLAVRLCRTTGVAGAVATAVIAGSVYVDSGCADWREVWRNRIGEIQQACASHSSSELRAALTDYRITAYEAAVLRLPRAEASTRWERTDALIRAAREPGYTDDSLAKWLLLDRALFSSAHDTGNFSNQATGASSDEMSGWLSLHDSKTTEAISAFKRSLANMPGNAMAWYGLARAQVLQPGRETSAARALSIACLLEPRFLFSPALERAPMAAIRGAALKQYLSKLTSAETGISSLGTDRLARYAAWRTAWDRAKGRVADFLDDQQSPATPTGAAACVRSRLRETLSNPDEAKIAAIFGSGVALLTDRHFNVGQAQRLFLRCQKGDDVWADPKGEHILRSRPLMRGWTSPYTEGGVGATLGEFEENIVIRLTCYGWEDATVHVGEAWLRSQLEGM